MTKKEEEAERLAEEYNRKMKILKTKTDLEDARNKMFECRSLREMIVDEGDGASAGGGKLSADEEATLEELEERIEACRAQLEYKDDHIKQIESSASWRQNDRGQDAMAQIEESCSTLEQSRTVIRVLFDMLVSNRRLGKQYMEKVQEMEEEKWQMDRALAESAERCVVEKRMYDQQLMRMTLDFEEKISVLIDQTQASGLLNDESDLMEAAPRTLVDSDGGSQELDSMEPQNLVMMDQYKCIAKLTYERNRALREQINQAHKAKEELEQRLEELELRDRRSRDELKEKDEQHQVSLVESFMTHRHRTSL